ncbi:hypothetical protein NDA01_23910 [Trichocoleus desertorum AS-A10]|uniref:hypothetical protein n=1 Tax=Trichocoleus desertorum TaxID=1481672 RepID=UPI003297C599
MRRGDRKVAHYDSYSPRSRFRYSSLSSIPEAAKRAPHTPLESFMALSIAQRLPPGFWHFIHLDNGIDDEAHEASLTESEEI